MPATFLHNYRSLSDAPRRFLVFASLNVLSWHSIVGPVLVLFARHIDMPPSWVGVVVSFVPLSMLLAFITVPLVEWLGPKRLMLITWAGRYLISACAFSLPWVLWYGHPRFGWIVLLFSVLGFCLIRSMGVGGWYPWLHEIVQPAERSRYFGAESSVEHGVIVITNLMHVFVLSFHATLYHYLGIYGVGVGCGLLSMLLLARVPGGKETPPHARAGLAGISRGMYRAVLADREFLVFVGLAACGLMAIAFLNTSSVMFMRDALGIKPQIVMLILTANSTGVFLTVRYWSVYAEHQGVAHGVFLTMGGLGALALALVFQGPAFAWTPYVLAPILVAAASLAAAYSVIMQRAMLDYVRAESRVAYTNIWILGAALSLGLSPIAVGFSIDALDLWGYRLCFVVCACAALTVCVLGRVLLHQPLTGESSAPSGVNLLSPVHAVARILWISAGLHPSAKSIRQRD
ncbi:MAG: hypothetical protein RLZZ303_470 [Candidatus Hydrogenedentota bacterium]